MLLRVGSHRVPSSTHVSKSQYGGQSPNFEPQETIKVWFTSIISQIFIIYAKTITEIFVKDPQLSTQVPSLTSKTYNDVDIHLILDLEIGTPCDVVSSNFHVLNS